MKTIEIKTKTLKQWAEWLDLIMCDPTDPDTQGWLSNIHGEIRELLQAQEDEFWQDIKNIYDEINSPPFWLREKGNYMKLMDEADPDSWVQICTADDVVVAVMPRDVYEELKKFKDGK